MSGPPDYATNPFLDVPSANPEEAYLLTPEEDIALRQAPRRSDPSQAGWSDPQIGSAEGVGTYAGLNGQRAEQTRLQYVDKVHRLGPFDNDQRMDLKTADRLRTPAPERAFIQKEWPGKGPGPGSYGGANRTNPMVTEQARALGRIGRAGTIGSALLGTAEILGSSDKPRAAAGVAGGWLGGEAGGVAGAEAGAGLGSLAGPLGGVIGAIGGGILGSAMGGAAGHGAGTGLVDRFRRHGQ